MLLTFRTGQEALAAVAESTSCTVGAEQLIVALQTPDWLSCVENEFRLTRSNTAETYAATSNSLLGEDFSIPSMSFDDMDGECIIFFTSVNPTFLSYPISYFPFLSLFHSLHFSTVVYFSLAPCARLNWQFSVSFQAHVKSSSSYRIVS